MKKTTPQETTCTDRHCPFHHSMPLHGRTFSGKIIRMNLHKSAVIEWQRMYYLPKYERYEKRRSRLTVHKPDCVQINIGDQVTVMETRPISKTKNFVIIEVEK